MIGPAPRLEVRRIVRAMRAERRAVARLHLTQLPESDLSELGEAFLEHFYYGALLDDDRYFCMAVLVDDDVAGFTAFSSATSAVIQRGVLRSVPLLAGIVLARIVRRPAAIARLWRIARSFLSLGAESYAEIPAEVMSTAVDPRYRTLEFHRRTGVNVSRTLYETTARTLASRGVREVKGFTRRSNHLVHAAISSLGWRKVFEGPHPRGTGTEDTCIWTWDVAEGLRRIGAGPAAPAG